MFPSNRIAPFQFSYQVGLLFPLEQIFLGMIFVMEMNLERNVWILKMIRDVSIAIDPLQKSDRNTSRSIIRYDFEFK